jgi:broad specificity phosphatase PhoE
MPSPLLYYIRHGETDWNAASRLQGQREIPINQNGRAQARRCGETLRELLARDAIVPAQLDYVASPLGRTRETMQIARAAMQLDETGYRVDARLTEISFGTWEGFTTDELRARWPEAVEARESDKWNYRPPGGESYASMSLRVHAWYQELSRDTVVVAHGGVLRGLLVQLGIATSKEAPFLDVAQGVVFVIARKSIARYA